MKLENRTEKRQNEMKINGTEQDKAKRKQTKQNKRNLF